MKPSENPIPRETLAGFSAAAILLILVSTTAVLAVRAYTRSAQWVSHTYEVVAELEGLAASFNLTEAARRGYVAGADPEYVRERDIANAKLRSHLDRLLILTSDNDEQQQRLRTIQRRLAQRTAEVDELIAVAQRDGVASAQHAQSTQEIQEFTQRINSDIEAAKLSEQGLLLTRSQADERSKQVLRIAFSALLIIVALLLGWLFVGLRRNMRERLRQAQRLERANHDLELANGELESFSYSVSHDLRSPLRAIDGYAQMLDEDYGPRLDETARRYIHVVRQGSQRMAALIDDLLAFSRLSRKALTRGPVDMTALARQVASETLAGAGDRPPRLRVEELPPAQGDPALLRQVWVNLIGNAIKYSAKVDAPEVHIRAQAADGMIRYEIQDNGVGFDMQYVDKLFGVFQRLHSSDEYPGTGVGLAIVHRIVARHGGAVSANGARGKGATFGFTLPAGVE